MNAIAIYDVDKTITKCDTFLQFYLFLIRKKVISPLNIFRIIWWGMLYICGFVDATTSKERTLFPLCNMTVEKLDGIAEDFWVYIKENLLLKDAVAQIKSDYAKGRKIFLISASPYFYIKKFMEMEEIFHVIATDFDCKDGIFVNKITNSNCKGEYKKNKFTAYMKENNFQYDEKNSVAYSDSRSDDAMFSLVKSRFLINATKIHSNEKAVYVRDAVNLYWK